MGCLSRSWLSKVRFLSFYIGVMQSKCCHLETDTVWIMGLNPVRCICAAEIIQFDNNLTAMAQCSGILGTGVCCNTRTLWQRRQTQWFPNFGPSAEFLTLGLAGWGLWELKPQTPERPKFGNHWLNVAQKNLQFPKSHCVKSQPSKQYQTGMFLQYRCGLNFGSW